MNTDELLLAQIENKIEQCEKRYEICYSSFLDLHQKKLVDDYCRSRGLNYGFYGGYDDAERTVAVFIPEYSDITYTTYGMKRLPDFAAYFASHPEDQMLSLIKITTPKGGRVLTHRDYLGSLLSLGLKREISGDILVRPLGADIFVLKDIADFIELNYSKAGHTNLSVSSADVSQFDLGDINICEYQDTVASLRLDNVVASAFKLPRTKAAEAVKSGIVFVNSLEQTKPDFTINKGDKIVLRGKGKVVLKEIGNRSKKDRIFLTFDVYK